MNQTPNPLTNQTNILYSIISETPPTNNPETPNQDNIQYILAENIELLLMIPENSHWLTLIVKSVPQISAKNFDLQALSPTFDIETGDLISNMTLSLHSRFFSIFFQKGILIIFSLTKLGSEAQDYIIERIHPSFKLNSFRFPLWQKSCLFYASQKDVFIVDPRIPFEFMEPTHKDDFLNQPSNCQHISKFSKFMSFDGVIQDFTCSQVLELFYVLLDFNFIQVVNRETNVIMKKIVSFSSSPESMVNTDICRIFPLLRVKRTDRPKLDDLKNHDFKMRDFILLLRKNGFLEVVRLRDFERKTEIHKFFSKKITNEIVSPEKIRFVTDKDQHFCSFAFDADILVFRLSEHFSQYNKNLHDKGKTGIQYNFEEFVKKELESDFFSEVCKIKNQNGQITTNWIESLSYVNFMTLVQNLQQLKDSNPIIPLDGTTQQINPNLNNAKINQVVSKTSKCLYLTPSCLHPIIIILCAICQSLHPSFDVQKNR